MRKILVDFDSGEVLGISSCKSAKKAIIEIGKKLNRTFIRMNRIDWSQYQLIELDDEAIISPIEDDPYIGDDHIHLIGHDNFPYYR